MIRSAAQRGTCLAARGFEPEDLTEGVQWGSIDLLGQWTLEADRVATF
jgi:sulfur relay (sulfurtransferase) complex TusBCD TusD component (DsrE family)